jgi:hypothetical protein
MQKSKVQVPAPRQHWSWGMQSMMGAALVGIFGTIIIEQVFPFPLSSSV